MIDEIVDRTHLVIEVEREASVYSLRTSIDDDQVEALGQVLVRSAVGFAPTGYQCTPGADVREIDQWRS